MKLFRTKNKDVNIEKTTVNNQNTENTEERSVGLLSGALNFSSVSSFQANSAMKLSAVYSAVNQISNAVAILPLYIYKSDTQGYKNIFYEHYAFNILNKQPSSNLSRFNFFKLLVSSIMLKGNGYAYIQRNSKGQVVSLRYLASELVTVTYDYQTDKVLYIVAGAGEDQIISSENMLHFWMYSIDGVRGISIIQHAIDTLSLSKDSEHYANNFYKSGASLSGILKSSAILTETQKEQIRNSWRQAFENGSNSGGIAIIPGGLDYQPISINAKDAQLLESREFSNTEIARFFNISPVKLFDLKNSSYSTLEQTQLEFLSDTVQPYLTLIEQEINRKLWLPSENNISANFDVSQFLNTDKQSMAEYYTKLETNGILTPNEVRKALSYSELENGDDLMIQLNMTTLKNIVNGILPSQSATPSEIKPVNNVN